MVGVQTSHDQGKLKDDPKLTNGLWGEEPTKLSL